MSDLLVVRSKIKDYSEGCNVAGDFGDALSKEVERLIKRGIAYKISDGYYFTVCRKNSKAYSKFI